MFDIIGDCHACIHELYELLDKLGYIWESATGTFVPPEGRLAVSVGDITSRGRYSVATYGFCRSMTELGRMLVVRGNHCDKVMRWAKGNNVKLLHGDDKAALEFEAKGIEKESIYEFFKSLPYYLILDEGKLVIVHAAWKNGMEKHDLFSKKNRSRALYGSTSGKTLDNGLPDRLDWVAERKEIEPVVVYGHQPYHIPRIENGTYGIDTGCVFGGHLTALKYPEMEIVQVKAYEKYAINKGWEE